MLIPTCFHKKIGKLTNLINFSYKSLLVVNSYTLYIEGNIFVCLSFSFCKFFRWLVCLFVCSSFSELSGIKSFSSGVYLNNHISESIHIWTTVTLEGCHTHRDSGWGWRSKSRTPLKSAVLLFYDICRYLTNHLLESIHIWTLF